MALTSTRAQDHANLSGENVVPGVPKAGYTPAKGHLVIRDTTLPDCWDLCANTENPAGLVTSTNSGNGTISVVMLVPGTVLLLQSAGVMALGNKVRCTGTALGTIIARTVVEADAGGVGTVTAVAPRGTDTVEVTF